MKMRMWYTVSDMVLDFSSKDNSTKMCVRDVDLYMTLKCLSHVICDIILMNSESENYYYISIEIMDSINCGS